MMTVVLLVATPAQAFDDPSQFFAHSSVPHSATLGASGEGLYFTGAPRFASQTCANCHVDGPQLVGLHLNAADPSLFSAGYEEGKTYQLQVVLNHEQRGTQFDTADGQCTEPPGPKDTYAYQQCNNNSFALEVDDANGNPLKGPVLFCPVQPVSMGGQITCATNTDTDAVQISPDGDAVFGNRTRDSNNPQTVTSNGVTAWTFYWTAPPTGSGVGPVTFYVSAVDGNGGTGVATNDQDPFGDDTVAAQFYVQQAGVATPTGPSAGCALARPMPMSPLVLGLMAFLLALVAWRRRRRR
jgi:hypothetical protein